MGVWRPFVSSTPLSRRRKPSVGKQGKRTPHRRTSENATAQQRPQASQAARVVISLLLAARDGKGRQPLSILIRRKWKDVHIYYLWCGLGGVAALLGVTSLLVRLWRLLWVITIAPAIILTVGSRGRACSERDGVQPSIARKMGKKYLEAGSTGCGDPCSGCSSRCWTWWKARREGDRLDCGHSQ